MTCSLMGYAVAVQALLICQVVLWRLSDLELITMQHVKGCYLLVINLGQVALDFGHSGKLQYQVHA